MDIKGKILTVLSVGVLFLMVSPMAWAKMPLTFTQLPTPLSSYSVGSSTDFVYKITLDGRVPHTQPLSISIGGDNPAAQVTRVVSATDNCGASIAPGVAASCFITLRYIPTSAAVIAPQLSVNYNYWGPLLAPVLSLTAVETDSLAFTAQPSSVGGTIGQSTNLDYTIQNTGTSTVSLSIPSTPATKVTKGTAPTNNCGAVLAASASCNFRMVYAPTASSDGLINLSFDVTYNSMILTASSIELYPLEWHTYQNGTPAPPLLIDNITFVVGYGSGASEQIYAGITGAVSGVAYTRNKEVAWTTEEGFPFNTLSSLFALDSATLDRIYIGTVFGLRTWNGTDWDDKSFAGSGSDVIFDIYATIFGGVERIYVATQNGLQVSRAGIWQSPRYLIGDNVRTVFADMSGVAGVERIFAGTSTQLFHSSNGAVFTAYSNLAPGKVNALRVTGSGSTTHIYVGTQANGLYISNDNGNSWINYKNNTTPGLPSAVSNQVNAMYVTGTGSSEHVYVATSSGLAVTRNGDKAQSAWTVYNASNQLQSSDIRSVWGNGTGSSEKIYVGTEAGLAIERATP